MDELPDYESLPCTVLGHLFIDSEDLLEREQAKALCLGCGHRLRCLQLAIKRSEPYGIWGGLDEIERGLYRKLFGIPSDRIRDIPEPLLRAHRKRVDQATQAEGAA